MKINKGIKLAVSILLPLLIGVIGSAATMPEIRGWYATINKPALLPPNWVFGPTWTLLYLLMGVSFYLVWTSKNSKKKIGMAWKWYLGQLGLNLLWSFLFFKWHFLFLAAMEIVTLWIVILGNIKSFEKINKLSANLLVPYLLWVTFATYLTVSVWLLN